jgi:hypothetical protein
MENDFDVHFYIDRETIRNGEKREGTSFDGSIASNYFQKKISSLL